MSFTKGNDRSDYARVYDRLRKRSYRSLAQWTLGNRHKSYLAGVRDALDAMQQIEDEHEAAALAQLHSNAHASFWSEGDIVGASVR